MEFRKIKKISIIFAINIFLFISNSHGQIRGCTDPLADNYNPGASGNDGSCEYPLTSVIPELSFNLSSNVTETSGIINWNNQLWTHNDSDDINIYALDTINGSVIKSYPLKGTSNTDWEEISQDDEYIYVGDFGNNQNGNRTDLKILRISKKSVLINSLEIDTIYFSYSDQHNFFPIGSNKSDFDCEAFIVASDSIFLFTKQWGSNKTSLYSLPKKPGIHIANLKSTLNVEGLITGAVYLETKKLIVLCGYSSLLEPFIYLLYDFDGSDYFNGNKRKITIALPYHQFEGISTTDGLKYYLTNESFSLLPFISVPQKLNIFDLSSFIGRYLTSILLKVPENNINDNILIYPNPSAGLFNIECEECISYRTRLEVYDYYGKMQYLKYLESLKFQEIDLSQLSNGIYYLKLSNNNILSYHKVVLQ